MFLEGSMVFLRPLENTDLEGAYLRGINNQEFDIFTEHALFPNNSFSVKKYAESKWESNDIWLGIFIKETQKHIGNIELSKIDFVHRKAGFFILIWAEHQKGYGADASRLLIDFAFNKLNLNRIDLGVHEHNIAALKLYEKLGFIEEGIEREAFIRGGEKYNIIRMSMLRKDVFV